MKLRMLVIALIAALGSGCASNDKPRSALKVEPVSTVRNGTPTVQAYYQLARYYHGQRRFAQAEEAYLKAIAADGTHADAFNGLAILYAERGQLDKSLKTFGEALVVAPQLAYVHNNLGYAYFLLKRYDDAYAEVRQALSLDGTLARGWSNLEQIAAARSDALLAEAAKARRAGALPGELVAGRLAIGTNAGNTPPVAAAAGAMVVSPAAATGESATMTMRVVESGAAGIIDARQEAARPVSLAASATPEVLPMAEQVEPPASSDKFLLVSAGDEVTLQVQSVAALSQVHEVRMSAEPVVRAAISPVRFEVSNGNGVTGFAKRFAALLRSDNVPVGRITNYHTYALKASLVEFQPGYESAARALIARANLKAQVLPATTARPGSDVRIVLGRDVVQTNAALPGTTVSQKAVSAAS